MPKAELLDPAGKAVAGALARGGHGRFVAARIGKRIELQVEVADDDAVAEAHHLAESFLSNSVIEDVISVYVAEQP